MKIGDIKLCWYYKNRYLSTDLELFWCRIEELGIEYAVCTLFYREEYNPKKILGIVKDICINDILN